MKNELPRILSGNEHGDDARLAIIHNTHLVMAAENLIALLEENKIEEAKAETLKLQLRGFRFVMMMADRHRCDPSATMDYWLDHLYPDRK